MKIYIWQVLTGLLCVSLVFCIVRLNSGIDSTYNLEQLSQFRNEKLDLANALITKHEDCILAIRNTIGQNLFKDQNDSLNSLVIDALFDKWDSNDFSNILFFRMSYKFCSTCIEPELANIVELKKTSKKICVFGTFPSDAETKKYREVYFSDLLLISIPESFLNIDSLNIDVPYYFELDNEFNVRSLLPIDTHNPELSMKWINN